MHRSYLMILLPHLLLIATAGRAATLNVTSPSSPISISQGANQTMALKLQNIESVVAQIAVWQVALSIEPEPGAMGTVEILNFSTPSDYVFNSLTSFGIAHVFGGELPSASAVFSDALVSVPPAAVLDGLTLAGLLDLTLVASHDATGEFRILMQPITGEFTDAFWIDPVEQGPILFGNDGPNATRNERTLTILRIATVPEQCGGGAALAMMGLVHFLNRHRQTQ